MESDDDEETKLAKEKAKKKTPWAVFDLKRDDEEAVRAKQLADIDEDGFQQSTFKSSRSDRAGAENAGTSVSAGASAHDDAIFGSNKVKIETPPADAALPVKQEPPAKPLSIIEKVFEVKLPDNMKGVDLKGLLAHPSLYEDPKIKDARWKKKWLEMRRKKLEEMKKGGVNGAPSVGISIY